MDEVAVLVEKVMPIKQSQGVTWRGRKSRRGLLVSGVLPGLFWKLIWHETQPREEETCIIRMSTKTITASPIIKRSLFVNTNLKLKIFHIEAIQTGSED